MTEQTALYRLYDHERRVLYIGISENVQARWAAHALSKSWWPEVVHKELEWLETREIALNAERRAIILERPVYNVVHSRSRNINRRVLPKGHNVAPNPPALPLYNALCEELARQGQTKTWLVRESGVSRAAINNLAKQPRKPQARTVVGIADALGIERQQALRLAGLAAPPSDAEAPLSLADVDRMSTADLAVLLHRISDVLGKLATA